MSSLVITVAVWLNNNLQSTFGKFSEQKWIILNTYNQLFFSHKTEMILTLCKWFNCVIYLTIHNWFQVMEHQWKTMKTKQSDATSQIIVHAVYSSPKLVLLQISYFTLNLSKDGGKNNVFPINLVSDLYCWNIRLCYPIK